MRGFDVRNKSRGFTLVEVVVGLAVMAVALLATAPLFLYAAKENAGGGDLGEVGVLAVERMERLRGTEYSSLDFGGSLASNVTDYSDTTNPDFTVRWTIGASPNPPAGAKIITVRAFADHVFLGRAKEVTLVTLRTE